MTQRAKSVLAFGRSLGLKGFDASAAGDREQRDDQEPSASSAALAAGRKAGLKGFSPESEQQAPRRESAVALATRLGLPGFEAEPKAAVPPEAPKPVSAINMPMRSATASPAMRTPPAPVAPPVFTSRLRFVQINIAAGGTPAFTALEGKMGVTFAPKIGGQAAWLQRENADGSQTRAYPCMSGDLTKLEALAGDLGPGLSMSVAPIVQSQFAMHSASGRVPAGSHVSCSFVDSGVPKALGRALGR